MLGEEIGVIFFEHAPWQNDVYTQSERLMTRGLPNRHILYDKEKIADTISLMKKYKLLTPFIDGPVAEH